MATWFDESRLDDEAALRGAATPLLRPLAESGARVRREAGDVGRRRSPRRVARRRRPARPAGGGRRRPGLPAAARGARAVVPGAVRGLARRRPARLGGQPRPGRRAGSRRRRHRHRLRGRRGGPPRLPGRRGLPAGLAGGRPRRRAAGRTLLPTVTGDQLATAVVMLDYLDQVGLGPARRRRGGGRRPRRGGDRLLARTATWRSTRPRCWPSRWPTPRRWSGAARCSPPGRPAGSPSRSGAPAAAPRWPATPSTCCPVIEATRPRDVFDDPFADGEPEPAPGAAGPRRRRRRPGRPRAARPARGPLPASAASASRR